MSARNCPKCQRELPVEILRARRYKQKLGLMILDIDHF